MDGNWNWASLDNQQMEMLQEAEQTLGAEILLAFENGERANVWSGWFSRNNLRVAELNESQVECLQGLEQKMGSVVIAYEQSH
ncbi:MAG: hypothetical protein EHM41_10785 [Chloroflexi bacterium]|nr:MAG: hypothetical protein EHM41_10785 [Chloroflexota bacterium]